jgi:hypothetical protein
MDINVLKGWIDEAAADEFFHSVPSRRTDTIHALKPAKLADLLFRAGIADTIRFLPSIDKWQTRTSTDYPFECEYVPMKEAIISATTRLDDDVKEALSDSDFCEIVDTKRFRFDPPPSMFNPNRSTSVLDFRFVIQDTINRLTSDVNYVAHVKTELAKHVSADIKPEIEAWINELRENRPGKIPRPELYKLYEKEFKNPLKSTTFYRHVYGILGKPLNSGGNFYWRI